MMFSGKVTRVKSGALFVKVPRLGRDEFGPMPWVKHRTTGTSFTAIPKAGDRVLVGLVEDSLDSMIVLGVIA